jgi:hypothetical protein
MASTVAMTLAPGWRWTLTMMAGVAFGPGAQAGVLGAVDDLGDVATCGRGASFL